MGSDTDCQHISWHYRHILRLRPGVSMRERWRSTMRRWRWTIDYVTTISLPILCTGTAVLCVQALHVRTGTAKKLKLKLWVRTVVKKTKFYCLIIFFSNQNLLKLWYVGKVSLYVTVKNKNYNILEMPDTFRTVFIIVSSCGLGVRFQCTLTKNFTFLTVFMIVSGNGLATRFRCALRISGSSM